MGGARGEDTLENPEPEMDVLLVSDSYMHPLRTEY